MNPRRPPTRRAVATLERCEDRSLMTLVFVLNGASFDAARPDGLTAGAAAVLRQAGNTVVQLTNPHINTPGGLAALAHRVEALAHGQTVGLVGFSAGGALALRIAATPGLHVAAVLDDYGVPDVRAFLNRHAADHFVRPISGLAPFRASTVAAFSGPLNTSARVVAAFGQFDPNVQAATSAADLLADDPSAEVDTYPGGHGAPITASPAALDDFLAHLG